MAVNDMYRIEVLQNVGSEPTMNVLHARETVAETILPIPAQCVVQLVYDFYQSIVDYFSEDWRVVSINARRVSPTGGIPATLVLGGAEAIVGTVESEIVPSQCALLVSLYTSNPSRSGRGRIYLPGWPEDYQNEGQITETQYIAIQDVMHDGLVGEKGPFLAGDGKYRFSVFGGGGSPTSEQDVLEALTRPNLATQRRRRAFPGVA